MSCPLVAKPYVTGNGNDGDQHTSKISKPKMSCEIVTKVDRSKISTTHQYPDDLCGGTPWLH